jgi:uncharacterized protein with ATP-grasp and redox domains
MKPTLECAACLFKWTVERCGIDCDTQEQFSLARTLARRLGEEFVPNGNVGKISIEVLESAKAYVSRSSEYFGRIKKASNTAAEQCLPSAAAFIGSGKDEGEQFLRACWLAAAANVSPIGAPTKAFEFSDSASFYNGTRPLPDSTGDLGNALTNVNHVLYLTDNAGEIGFDSLLIQLLKSLGLNVTLIVKKDPFFDDATISDAAYFGIDRSADEILEANFQFIPGVNDDALEAAYGESELIIAKGVLNFETHYGEPSGKRIIHLLKAKCHPIATLEGVQQGQPFVDVTQFRSEGES